MTFGKCTKDRKNSKAKNYLNKMKALEFVDDFKLTLMVYVNLF